LYKSHRNNQQDATVYQNLLFQCLLNARHVSSDTPLIIIIRSSTTVIAASGWVPTQPWQLPATTNVCKTRGCNYSFWAPDDERRVARNMSSN